MDDLPIPQIKPDKENSRPVFQRVSQGTTEMVDNSIPDRPDFVPNLLRRTEMTKNIALGKRQGRFNGNRNKNLKIIFIIVGVFIFINLLIVTNLLICGKKLVTNITKLKSALTSQNLDQLKTELTSTKTSLVSFQGAYKYTIWMRVIPLLGVYVGDGQHVLSVASSGLEIADVLVQTIEPYADLIGFKGGVVSTSGEKTTADRIDFIVKAIPDILPKLEQISTKMKAIKTEVNYINPNHYPMKFGGREVRSKLEAGLDLVDQLSEFVGNGKPVIELAPSLLGLDKPKTYLVIFQNDKELRPTGGFITAYSIMKVDKAKFSPVDSSDIYSLDAKYKPVIEAPQPIIDYLKGPYILSKKLYLRDMNWYPDFGESMKVFTGEINKVGIRDIDGVIAVDTQLLVNLLKVIGPIGVPGFGNFSVDIKPECNCPQVIYELENFADVEGPIVWDPAGTGKIIYAPPNSDNRKKIIGPLMNSIMSNAFGQPKDKLPALFEAGFKSLIEKHIIFYLFDNKAQKAFGDFGIAGTVKDYDGDYLNINDANLGGRKSNLYITQEVEQQITILKDKSVEKTLTITYKNPEKQDGWLNSILPNWVRIYVPKGSSLISMDGLENKPEPYEEYGKTVFAGYFQLRPQGVSKVEVKYKLPFKVNKEYKLFIQKQPGKDAPLYIYKIGNKENELYLNIDKEVKVKI